jgi:non-heme chloroperoxidase
MPVSNEPATTLLLPSGVELSYVDQGPRSAPALVLVPGPLDSWRSYQPVLERLPPSIRTVAMSPRGHGDSAKPATGYGIEELAADVVDLFDGLEIERAVLAGHSGSCLVVRRVAIDHPERVAGLVLEASPTTLRGDPGLTEFVGSVVAGLRDPIDPELARSVVVDTSAAGLDPDLVDRLVADVLQAPARVWRALFAAVLDYDDTAELGRIAAPARLVWGDADGLVGREMQDQLVARLPAAELLTYPGVGHTPRWQAPERFAADAAAFVDAVLPTGV